MAKRLCNMLDILEGVDLISRAGGKPTTKKTGKLAGASFYRAKRLLLDAKESGLINCYERRYRQNSTAKVWVLTTPGLKIVRAYQDGMRSQGWALGSPREYVGGVQADKRDG